MPRALHSENGDTFFLGDIVHNSDGSVDVISGYTDILDFILEHGGNGKIEFSEGATLSFSPSESKPGKYNYGFAFYDKGNEGPSITLSSSVEENPEPGYTRYAGLFYDDEHLTMGGASASLREGGEWVSVPIGEGHYTNTGNEEGALYCNYGGRKDFYEWLLDHDVKYEDFPDPGGNSGAGGGTGSFNGSSDSISFPGLPGLSAVDTGFITLYKGNPAAMKNLIAFMWSDRFDMNTYKKIFASPMDMIVGLSIVPVDPPVGQAKEIIIGGVHTGVVMNVLANQYVTVNCGSLAVNEFWGSALDYSPYTKFSIYLPYIGVREIKTDDIMGKSVSVSYNVDVLSGSCTACVMCGGSVLYQYSGGCATPVPVSSSNWTQSIVANMQLATALVGAAASGVATKGASLAKDSGALASATANAVLSAKPQIQRSGAVSGSAGLLGIQKPYLIAEIPRQSLPHRFSKHYGLPSNISAYLQDLKGFTVVEKIQLSGIPATDEELIEIEELLKDGVIL